MLRRSHFIGLILSCFATIGIAAAAVDESTVDQAVLQGQSLADAIDALPAAESADLKLLNMIALEKSSATLNFAKTPLSIEAAALALTQCDSTEAVVIVVFNDSSAFASPYRRLLYVDDESPGSYALEPQSRVSSCDSYGVFAEPEDVLI